MCDDNGKTFIASLYNILLAPDLCDKLFSIVTLMNAGHIFFHKGFCTVYFGTEKKNAVTLSHSAQRKYAFLVKIKDMSKINILPSRKEFFLEVIHQRLGHRYNRLLLDGDTKNLWEGVELRIDPDPFCTSCQISSMKKRLGLKYHSSQGHLSSGFL